MQHHRDIGHDWNLSPEQIWKLNDWIEANELLVQCLKLAVVSDRKGIAAGLLLPPKATTDADSSG